ncbi:MAG: IS200/IS605 family transposase [Candidatus Sumerlaeota bacterium]|nr:IS200/IS605 family transposase [Candidatus Sumerlaeota bacterium]
MSTYTQIYYHLIYSTKNRDAVLRKDKREDLFRYAWGIFKNKKCVLYRINGIEDHLHFFFDLHPTVALADLVRDLKTSTTSWIKTGNVFPGFTHWQDGYGAFTKSHEDKDAVVEYIKRQEEHHQHETSIEEMKRLMKEEGIDYDENFLE